MDAETAGVNAAFYAAAQIKLTDTNARARAHTQTYTHVQRIDGEKKGENDTATQ